MTAFPPRTAHEKLFDDYVEELCAAHDAVQDWWIAFVDAATAASERERPTIEFMIRKRWRFGPATHPYIVGIIRKYVLACQRLNTALEAQGRGDELIYPMIFTTEWLLDDHEDLAMFIEEIPYWPLGVDTNGDYT